MKAGPSIAEIKLPSKENQTNFKVIYDYDDPRYYENVQLDEETANVTKTTIKLDKVNTDGSRAKSVN
jgi:hypothetical protein